MIIAPVVLDPPHARAALRVGVTQAVPGKAFLAAVEITTDPHWHVYWKNPGDSGVPTRIAWRAPSGWKVEPLEFPTPRRFTPGGIAAYGYEGTTLFLARVTPSARSGALTANVSWLVCKEACVQGSAALSRAVRLGRKVIVSADAKRLQTAQAGLPKPTQGWTLMASRNRSSVDLVVQPASPISGRAEFFPAESGLVDHSKPFVAALLKGRYVFEMDVSPFPENRTRLRGLLVPGGSRRHAVTIDTRLVNGD